MKIYKKMIAIVATVIIMIVPVLVMWLPKRNFSENENRVLQGVPEYSAENLLSGQFGDDIEKYVNDHFPLRDHLVSVKTRMQVMIGYKELNEVFVTKKRLLQHIEKPDDTIFIQRVNKLCNNLYGVKAQINLMVVPTNAEVYRELLPAYAPDVVREQAVIDDIYGKVNCGTIDVLKPLLEAKDKTKNLYYNLDHHWNFFGAYVGYEQFCKAKGIMPKTVEAFEPECVSRNFKGSLYSKVLLDSMKPDEIFASGEKNKNIVVNYCDMKKTTDTYYDKSFLNKKDKYCYFGGGNQALMIIENQEADNDKELVLVKDSFANCFIPFILDDYRKIHVIDPRYYRPHISDYVKQQENITDILLLYNIDSLNINNGISKIK